jgi:hypothetical protein
MMVLIGISVKIIQRLKVARGGACRQPMVPKKLFTLGCWHIWLHRNINSYGCGPGQPSPFWVAHMSSTVAAILRATECSKKAACMCIFMFRLYGFDTYIINR